MNYRPIAILAGAAALLLGGAGAAHAASTISGIAYDAEITAQAREESPYAIALRLRGSVDARDAHAETAVGLTLELPGTTCASDAVTAFDDPLTASSVTAVGGAGPFAETVVIDDAVPGSYVLCSYLFQDEGQTYATASWEATIGEPAEDAGAPGGSASGGSGESPADDDSLDVPVEIGDGAGTSSCLFSRPPVRASRKLTLFCPGLEGTVTVSAFGRGRTRQLTLQLHDGRASVKANRLGLQRKRSVSVRVEQGEDVLLETDLKLRPKKQRRR